MASSSPVVKRYRTARYRRNRSVKPKLGQTDGDDGLAEGNDVIYPLVLSEDERRRYRFMAETAHTEEAALWSAGGVCAGAAVADIGCGPGVVLRLLAQEVGPGGRADGVDNAPGTVTAGADEVGDLPQATVRRGEATATGLPAGGYDVVMCRHVLAHNGGRETVWMRPEDPNIAELQARYVAYHRDRGNDLNIGRSLGLLLEAAGSTVEHYRVSGPVIRLPPGLRSPAWAAAKYSGLPERSPTVTWTAGAPRSPGSTPVPTARGPPSPPASPSDGCPSTRDDDHLVAFVILMQKIATGS